MEVAGPVHRTVAQLCEGLELRHQCGGPAPSDLLPPRQPPQAVAHGALLGRRPAQLPPPEERSRVPGRRMGAPPLGRAEPSPCFLQLLAPPRRRTQAIADPLEKAPLGEVRLGQPHSRKACLDHALSPRIDRGHLDGPHGRGIDEDPERGRPDLQDLPARPRRALVAHADPKHDDLLLGREPGEVLAPDLEPLIEGGSLGPHPGTPARASRGLQLNRGGQPGLELRIGAEVENGIDEIGVARGRFLSARREKIHGSVLSGGSPSP